MIILVLIIFVAIVLFVLTWREAKMQLGVQEFTISDYLSVYLKYCHRASSDVVFFGTEHCHWFFENPHSHANSDF